MRLYCSFHNFFSKVCVFDDVAFYRALQEENLKGMTG
jgi:hypothetical protein